MATVALGRYAAAHQRKLRIGALIVFLLMVALAIFEYQSVSDHIASVDEDFRGLANVGWGIYLIGFSGAVGAIACYVDNRQSNPSDAEHQQNRVASSFTNDG